MAKNLIPEIAKMLGVELGEEFKVKGAKGAKGADGTIFWFDLDGLHAETCEMADVTLWQLVLGNETIIKLSWQPKFGDRYFGVFEFNGKLRICRYDIWRGTIAEEAQYRCGWVFRTREEAEAALPKVAAELGVDYEL